MKKRYILENTEEQEFMAYLRGERTCKEMGKTLGISHQQAINLIGVICKQWIQEGKLIIKE